MASLADRAFCFYPRPRERCGCRTARFRTPNACFYSRTREGCDEALYKNKPANLEFQPTHPQGCDKEDTRH